MIAPLPRSDLHDAAGFRYHSADELALVDRERQRLLAIHVLAGATGIDEHLRVPMVGRANRDDVDVAAREQVAIVFVDRRRAAKRGPRLLANIAIDVADRNDIAMRPRFVGDHRALIAHADAANARPVIFAGSAFGVARLHDRPTGCSRQACCR